MSAAAYERLVAALAAEVDGLAATNADLVATAQDLQARLGHRERECAALLVQVCALSHWGEGRCVCVAVIYFFCFFLFFFFFLKRYDWVELYRSIVNGTDGSAINCHVTTGQVEGAEEMVVSLRSEVARLRQDREDLRGELETTVRAGNDLLASQRYADSEAQVRRFMCV